MISAALVVPCTICTIKVIDQCCCNYNNSLRYVTVHCNGLMCTDGNLVTCLRLSRESSDYDLSGVVLKKKK